MENLPIVGRLYKEKGDNSEKPYITTVVKIEGDQIIMQSGSICPNSEIFWKCFEEIDKDSISHYTHDTLIYEK